MTSSSDVPQGSGLLPVAKSPTIADRLLSVLARREAQDASEVGGQERMVRVVELGGHLRNGDGRILPEPLCRFLEPVAV